MDKKYAIIRLFIALCLVFMSGQSLATSPPKSPAKANDAGALSIDLTVIQASKTGAIDTRLDPELKKQLPRTFSDGFKGFTFVEKHAFSVNHADSVVKRLKNTKVIAFSNMGRDGGKLRVRLDFDGANVMMRVREGELWFHARRQKGGKALILAVRARSK